MNDDELRSALDSYAARAPHTDPRPALAGRLARRRRTRVAVTAFVAVAVAAAGAVVLTRDERRGALVAADPTPSSPAASSPAPRSGPTVVRARGHEGLRVTLTLDPANPATASETVLDIHATDDHGQPEVQVLWGDGDTFERRNDDSPLCGTLSTRRSPGSLRELPRHSWRRPGPVTITVVVRSWVACAADTIAYEETTAMVQLRVVPGVVTTNGPARPRRESLDVFGGRTPRERTVSGMLSDPDGYVGGAVVDWGDGTSSTATNPDPCSDSGGVYFPRGGRWQLKETHTYARPGQYVLTVHFDSTGCGGGDRQEAKRAFWVLVR